MFWGHVWPGNFPKKDTCRHAGTQTVRQPSRHLCGCEHCARVFICMCVYAYVRVHLCVYLCECVHVYVRGGGGVMATAGGGAISVA